MPKRNDIHKILIIGSGPIIISQACEFDYSGVQACKALRSEGFEVVLINSNPATIMTDPEMAQHTYIEPVTPEFVERVIEKERPDAILPTLGGQTALNVAVKIADAGVLKKYNVKMIGANSDVIKKAEDRELFKKAMQNIGLDLPRSAQATNMEEAREIAKEIGFPLVVRPSFTLGGTGGGFCYNVEEFETIAANGLAESMVSEILIEESIEGWKEYELEVMRDVKDNVVIICSIENFDPMGVHTGDSITVAPIQTLTDKEYQKMRDAAIAVIREIGVETGGSNVQFAVDPKTGRMVIIEMNPRVSRSSALASKATGFPIAKIAAKLAVGYTLDEIPNDITKETPASFEPVLDYCVVKIPRFTFEKFPGANTTLTVSMKSVGEAMSIGRTFKEALQKGLRSLEVGAQGLDDKFMPEKLKQYRVQSAECREENIKQIREEIIKKLRTPNDRRVFFVKYAMQAGMSIEEIFNLTKIDRWFLDNIKQIVELEEEIIKQSTSKQVNKSESKKTNLSTCQLVNLPLSSDLLRQAKEYGFSDIQIARLLGTTQAEMRSLRKKAAIYPTYKLVDTCAAEFEAFTPYFYSSYDLEDEPKVDNKEKVIILGGGPNRIGQGIEFDYCCVHCSFALKELGYETIMVNSNPETVSTDYDTSDKLYFEPLTGEDVLNIAEKESAKGVIVQFGGQTPLNLAEFLKKSGINILGTSPESIDRAEDRKLFKEVLDKLHLKQAENGTAKSFEEAKKIALQIGYPIVVRPSYVLGGRAMKIVYDEEMLEEFMLLAVEASPEHPILIDKFLEDAIEIDVDAVADGNNCIVCGIMEHIEEAGIHSGDSASVIPPFSLSSKIIEQLKNDTKQLAKELNVIGLMNIQYAVKNDTIYILEVNPRASRTVPFVSKATGVPWAKIAAKVMLGKKLKELGITKEIEIDHVAVKESVFPFNKFPGVDPVLGPEMKSTGEVMGIDKDFGLAFAKSQIAAGSVLPLKGNVFISVNDRDKRSIVLVAKKLIDLGFKIFATKETSKVLSSNGIEVTQVLKVSEGRPNVVDLLKNRDVQLLINTPSGKKTKSDHISIRAVAVMNNIPIITTIQGARAAVNGIESLIKKKMSVTSIQEYHKNIRK